MVGYGYTIMLNSMNQNDVTPCAVTKIQMSRNYWLPLPSLPSRKLYVCKDMFLRTFGHKSDKVITTALSTTSPIGMNTGGKRGKHSPKHKVSEEDRTFLVNHIRSFKSQISHYRRKHAPNRFYLPPPPPPPRDYNEGNVRELR